MPLRHNLPKHTSKHKSFSIGWIFIFVLVLLCFGVGLLLLTSDVNSQKTEVLITDGSNNVTLVFDPDTDQVRSVNLPGSTQVELASNLGKLDLGNAWEVGKNEGRGGELLVKTIVKNFTIPVYLWVKVENVGTISSFLGKLKFVFTPEETNINFLDRVVIAWKLSSLADPEKIDLESWGAIRKATLIDGRNGYILGDAISGKLLLAFAEKQAENKGLKAKIVYPKGGVDVANSVSSILATMGIKVAQMEQGENTTCEVAGSNKKLEEKIAKVLGDCKVGKMESGNFDIVVTLSEKFISGF